MSTPNSKLSKDASVERLACLFRHWTSADEAMARFDRGSPRRL